MNKLPNIPNKGYSDWFPEEFAKRKYIFDTWRKVCQRFGYEEYMVPFLEDAAIYRAKSGEDAGGKELMILQDRGGRDLAIRPEMTPSVSRMVTRIYQETPKPIKYFSIANFIRNQKPQRGRNREFWQLNYDIFGNDTINSDIEILQIAMEIMLAFNPPAKSFTVFINNRKLIDAILNSETGITQENKTEIVRILDKWEKFPIETLKVRLCELGMNNSQIERLEKFVGSRDKETLLKNFPEIAENEGYITTNKLIEAMTKLGYGDWVTFNPSIIRGFDYYDGMVFEVFDNKPENNRSLFGGGRYNGLAGLFGGESFPAVGCAPGDETTYLFLESWNLFPESKSIAKVYVTVFDDSTAQKANEVISLLRKNGINTVTTFGGEKFDKQLKYADKKGIPYVVIIGPDEIKKGVVVLKNLTDRTQVELTEERLVDCLKG